MFNQIPLAGAAVTRSYLHGEAKDNLATSHTFTSVPLGTEHPDRRILVVQGANASKSSCTVAGNASSLLVSGNSGTYGLPVSFWMLNLPTGTSGSIVVSGSNSRGCGIHVYSLTPASDTLVGTVNAVGGSLTAQACVVGGAFIGEATTPPLSISWTNLTEDGAVEWLENTVYYRLSAASRGDAPSSLTLSPTGTNTPNMAAASFKPF